MKTLIIIGCGPKAIAIAAKAYVLKQFGWSVPKITIIDMYIPAAHWDGTHGYTNGGLILGTSPLEDVGFPYTSSDHRVNFGMLQFSWQAYLIANSGYGEWINRGLPSPTHVEFANYLRWVVDRIDIKIIKGKVFSINSKGEEWEVFYGDDRAKRVATGDGLVITGPGEPYHIERDELQTKGVKNRIFNGKDIWNYADLFRTVRSTKIAVIGGGETAGGVVTFLARTVDSSNYIEIINGHGMIFTRNENWMENRYFTNATNWYLLNERQRVEIIQHADRGTFSPKVKELLDSYYNVHLQIGRAKTIRVDRDKLYLILEVNNKRVSVQYDYIIEATGFDPFSFMKLFRSQVIPNNRQEIIDNIDYDLSLKGLSPKIYLPTLAAFSQGPGFCNLSCLGLLSERVLGGYIKKLVSSASRRRNLTKKYLTSSEESLYATDITN